jgi:LacI family transcriptional regulator
MAEVDRAIVSRVLSNDSTLRIRDETRQRVMEVVARVGFRPNPLARSLRTKKTGVVALLVPEIEDPAWGAIIAGAEAEAKERGLLVMVARTSEPGGADAHVEQIGPGRVDGIVLAGADISEDTQRWLDAAGISVLRLNRRGPASRRRYLALDNAAAVAIAVRHLVALGHRRIGFLAGPPLGDYATNRRREGFLEALEDAGIDAGRAALEEVDLTLEAGSAALGRMMRRRGRVTAIVVANVPAAFGALQAAAEQQLDVPSDLSFIAVEDQPFLGFASPRITAVRAPLEQLGRRAMELVATLGAEQSVREVIDGPLELIDRGSTAPPRGRAAPRGTARPPSKDA